MGKYVYKVYQRARPGHTGGPDDKEVKCYSQKRTADAFIAKQDDPDMFYVTRFVTYRKTDGSIGYCLPLTYLTIKVPASHALGSWY